MTHRPIIYIAGPYTNPDPIVNTREAIQAGMEVYEKGGAPVIPHLTMFIHFLTPRDLNFWYDFDFALLDRADAVYRIPGLSSGATAEVDRAIEAGTPVFYEDNWKGLCDFIIGFSGASQ